MIQEKLEAFSKDRQPISFIAQFSSSFASEPKEMNVKLEYIKVDEINEIHGIISPIIEDNLLKYFILERQKYEIGNYLTVVDDITYNIVKNLKKYMDHSEVSFIRIGLREMIINAIQHGNLEITYKEKSLMLAYLLVQLRIAEPFRVYARNYFFKECFDTAAKRSVAYEASVINKPYCRRLRGNALMLVFLFD